MDRPHLRQLLPELRKDLVAARARMDEAAAEVAALETTISGLEFLSGGAPEPTIPLDFEGQSANGSAAEFDSPRGQEAVRRVLRDDGGPMKAQAVVKEIQQRGWIDPEAKNPGAAIRIAIRRLAEAGEVEKVATGVYKYAQRFEGVEAKTEA